jgi:hypothetical protein
LKQVCFIEGTRFGEGCRPACEGGDHSIQGIVEVSAQVDIGSKVKPRCSLEQGAD